MQIMPQIKEERSKKLIELSNYNEEQYNNKYVGKEVEVLWEEQKSGIYKGHTKNYILVELNVDESNAIRENSIEKIKIKKADKHAIIGTK